MRVAQKCLGSEYTSKIIQELHDRPMHWGRMTKVVGHPEKYIKSLLYESSKKLTLHNFLTLMFEFKAIKTLKAIGNEIGCIVYQVPESETTSGLIMKKAVGVMKEAVKTLEIVESSLEDQVYTAEEKQKTYEEIDRAMEALLELKECLKKDDMLDSYT